MRKTKNFMATHSTIGEFDGDRESRKSYTERLVQYFAVNDVVSADKKHAILLSVCGPTMYQLIILAPVKPTEHTLAQLVKIVEQHRNPKPSVIVQKYNSILGSSNLEKAFLLIQPSYTRSQNTVILAIPSKLC